jgi:hypothetical protein
MAVGSNIRTGRKPLRVVFASVLSLLLVLVTFSLAFGDFVPVTTTKVLGVGRIQSALPATPVVAAEKFALETEAASPEQTSELVEPIGREVAVIEFAFEPEFVPELIVEQEVLLTATPAESDAEWITTQATNYATPGDGFLGKKTASGALTSTTSMAVAHKNLPLGTQVELYNPRTGLSCVAVVNDRGPYDGRSDTFDFQMGVTSALGNSTGWYTIQYRVL